MDRLFIVSLSAAGPQGLYSPQLDSRPQIHTLEFGPAPTAVPAPPASFILDPISPDSEKDIELKRFSETPILLHDPQLCLVYTPGLHQKQQFRPGHPDAREAHLSSESLLNTATTPRVTGQKRTSLPSSSKASNCREMRYCVGATTCQTQFLFVGYSFGHPGLVMVPFSLVMNPPQATARRKTDFRSIFVGFQVTAISPQKTCCPLIIRRQII